MGSLNQRVYAATIPIAASISTAIDLAGGFQYVFLEIPVLTGIDSASPVYVQGSSDGTTFRRIAYAQLNTSTVAVNDFVIASSASNRMVELPDFAFRYVKVEVSGAATQAVGFKIICSSTN